MIVVLIVITGLMAGIYFSFSVFIMKSFSMLPGVVAATAMNKINDVIVNTAFLPVFVSSTLWFFGLIIWSIADWQGLKSQLVIAAAVIYIVGMFSVTAFGNVPLNNALRSSANDEMSLVTNWRKYLKLWTRLNHIRTLSCIAACTLLTLSQISV